MLMASLSTSVKPMIGILFYENEKELLGIMRIVEFFDRKVVEKEEMRDGESWKEV